MVLVLVLVWHLGWDFGFFGFGFGFFGFVGCCGSNPGGLGSENDACLRKTSKTQAPFSDPKPFLDLPALSVFKVVPVLQTAWRGFWDQALQP